MARKEGSWCHELMKSLTHSISLSFYSAVRLWGIKCEQLFRFPRSSRTMMLTVSLLIPNSSAINRSVIRRFLALSESCHQFCWWTDDRSVIHLLPTPSRPWIVWTSRKHTTCWPLLLHTHESASHVSRLPSSLTWNRTSCSLVAPFFRRKRRRSKARRGLFIQPVTRNPDLRALHGSPIDIQCESVCSASRSVSGHSDEHFCACACA